MLRMLSCVLLNVCCLIAYPQIVAGATAGLLEVCLMYPLGLIEKHSPLREE
jgi:hypothetical protein